MIVANKSSGVAELCMTDTIAAMRADVYEHAKASIALSNHQNIVFAHVGRQKVPWLPDLALMRHEKPASSKNRFEFALINRGVRENSPINPPILRVDETRQAGDKSRLRIHDECLPR